MNRQRTWSMIGLAVMLMYFELYSFIPYFFIFSYSVE
jgi:hypothetical protein